LDIVGVIVRLFVACNEEEEDVDVDDDGGYDVAIGIFLVDCLFLYPPLLILLLLPKPVVNARVCPLLLMNVEEEEEDRVRR